MTTLNTTCGWICCAVALGLSALACGPQPSDSVIDAPSYRCGGRRLRNPTRHRGDAFDGAAARTADRRGANGTTVDPTCEFDPDESSFVDVSAAELEPAELCEVFDSRQSMLGADYQRAYALPDGRILWLFQDAFLSTSTGPELVHNVGLLQDGTDFELLRSGTSDWPTPYLFADATQLHHHWYWPLGGDVGLDGRLHVFVAELVERGPRLPDASSNRSRHGSSPSTSTTCTWSTLSRHPIPRANCMAGRSSRRATTPTCTPTAIASSGTTRWRSPRTCRLHDYDCTADVTVARLPRGDFTARPEYWDGVEWGDDPLAAVPVIPQEGRIVNPTQVAVHNGQFVAVTKEGDWWGNTIYLDVAPAAEGPWRTYSAILVAGRMRALQHLLRLDRPLRRRRGVLRHRPVVQRLGGSRLRPLQPDLHASPRARVTTRTGAHTSRQR